MNSKINFALLIVLASFLSGGCKTETADSSPSAKSNTNATSQQNPETVELDKPTSKGSPTGEAPLPSSATELKTVAATDWMQFRGTGCLATTQARLPEKFDSSFVQWQAELLGRGASTPIVVGDKVFLTSYSGYGESLEKPGKLSELQYHVYCFDRVTGKLNWLRNIKGNPAETPRLNPNLCGHGFASGTMVSDGKRVFVSFGIGGVFAFDVDGEFLWQQDVGWKYHNFGSSSSLTLLGDLLFVNASIESGAVYAFDTKSGNAVWKIDNVVESWTTPIVGMTSDGKPELVIAQKNIVRGFEPTSGKELWTCEGILDYIIPTPVIMDGIAYCNGGKQNRTLAIRLGGRGDVTTTHKLWEAELGANVPSSIVFGEHLYQVHDNALVQVLEAKTGEVIKRQRLKGAGPKAYGSPLLVGDKLFVPFLHGIAVVNATPELGLVAMNKITDDEAEFRASLAVSGDRMFTRNDNLLFCIAPEESQDNAPIAMPSGTNLDVHLSSTAKYDFDTATGRVRTYNRCLLETPDELRTFILIPYKSVITEEQTASSMDLIRAEFPKFAAFRAERKSLIWNHMKRELSDEDFTAQISALDKKVMATQAALRTPIKAMFSKEQMDQHMAEHRAWMEKNKKK